MKPQSIEYLIECYVREKNRHYDEVDGVRRHGPNHDYLAGEATIDLDDRCNELQFMYPQNAEPVVEPVMVQPHHVPLSPEMEDRAKRFARQLIDFSDQFEFIHSTSRTQSSDSTGIEFKDHNIFVPAGSNVIKISVFRKDGAEQPAKAKWKTCDKTAKSGIHFVGSEGDILFNEGDIESIIEIMLLENSNDSGIDKRFQVELFDPEGNNVGKRNCITVNIDDQANFYQDERQIVENMKRIGSCATINSVASCLMDKVNSRTFHAALQCLCATAASYQEELALAFELTRIVLPKARRVSLSNVVSDFFRYLPELEEILQ